MSARSGDLLELLGVPFRLGGREVTTGLDCLGLVLECCHRDRIPMLDVWATWREAYSSGWRDFQMALPPGWEFIERTSLERGDVLILLGEGDLPCHLAYCVSSSRVLTTAHETGVVSLPICQVSRRITSCVRSIRPRKRGEAC